MKRVRIKLQAIHRILAAFSAYDKQAHLLGGLSMGYILSDLIEFGFALQSNVVWLIAFAVTALVGIAYEKLAGVEDALDAIATSIGGFVGATIRLCVLIIFNQFS